MRITKNFRSDQEFIQRFLDILGKGSSILSSSKQASPGFFMFAHGFIQEYINEVFFKKENLLFTALENSGFPIDGGPIGTMLAEQEKSRESAKLMGNAAKDWLNGDDEARGEVGWAASEYTSTLRQHMDRLKNLIFPLLEQNLSTEDEHAISEGLNHIAFESEASYDVDKFKKLIESLDDELSDW